METLRRFLAALFNPTPHLTLRPDPVVPIQAGDLYLLMKHRKREPVIGSNEILNIWER